MSASSSPSNPSPTNPKTPTGGSASSTHSGSPITGIIDERNVVIDFGKYEGKTVFEMSEMDPDFYQKLASEKENGVFAIRRHRDKTFRLYINPLTQMDV
jgi:hypothetical protein